MHVCMRARAHQQSSCKLCMFAQNSSQRLLLSKLPLKFSLLPNYLFPYPLNLSFPFKFPLPISSQICCPLKFPIPISSQICSHTQTLSQIFPEFPKQRFSNVSQKFSNIVSLLALSVYQYQDCNFKNPPPHPKPNPKALLFGARAEVICLCHQRAIFQGPAVDLAKWLEEPGAPGRV